MARSRRYRAPDFYGAWVDGEWFAPGEFLPEGTTQFTVRAIENLTGTKSGWRTVSLIAGVGVTFDELEDEFGALFTELSEEYGIRF